MSIVLLPPDCLQLIALELPIDSLIRFFQTCKQTYKLDNPLFWKNKFQKDFPTMRSSNHKADCLKSLCRELWQSAVDEFKTNCYQNSTLPCFSKYSNLKHYVTRLLGYSIKTFSIVTEKPSPGYIGLMEIKERQHIFKTWLRRFKTVNAGDMLLIYDTHGLLCAATFIIIKPGIKRIHFDEILSPKDAWNTYTQRQISGKQRFQTESQIEEQLAIFNSNFDY